MPLRTSEPRGCVSAHASVFFAVVAFGVAFDDIGRTFIHDSEMRCIRDDGARAIARETTTRCDVGRIRVHVGGRVFLLASARGDGLGRPSRSCHPLRLFLHVPSLSFVCASSSVSRPRTIRGVFFLLVDARARVVPWCLSHLLPREKKLSSPLLSIGSERGKVDRFVRVRTRFPSGFVVGSNPNDGPIEPGWWWRKTPSDHHRSGNTNTRHVRHHVRETSVDVDRNVRNQG